MVVRVSHTREAWGSFEDQRNRVFKPAIDEHEQWESTRNDKTTWYYLWEGFFAQSTAVRLKPTAGERYVKGFLGQAHHRPKVTASASFARSFTDLFYGRVQLNPSYIDMGAVLTAQSRQIELWNATFSPVTIEDITEVDSAGVRITLDGPLPFTLPPLKAVTGTVTAEPAGPSEIKARFQILTSVAQKPPLLAVVGSRSVIFAIPPDTSKPYLEKVEWSTDIITAYDGSEQRISVHDGADVTLTMTVFQQGRRAHLMDSFLWGWQDKIYTLPLWHRATALSTVAAAGETTVFCSTADVGLRVDTVIMLWLQDNRYEVQEIAEVHADRVVVKRPLVYSWPRGTSAMACRPARLPAEVQTTWTHGDLASFQLSFIYTELEDPDLVADWGGYYRNYSVLLQQPNWVQPVTEKTTREMDVLETDTKARFVRVKNTGPYIVRNFAWFLNSKEKVRRFRGWMYARRGRAVPFWAPSWKADFKLKKRVAASEQQLTVENVGFQALYQQKQGKSDIAIFLRNGTILYRRITSSATGITPETEVLILDSAINFNIEMIDVLMICFLSLYRLDGDSAELDWRSDKLVLCSQNMRLLSNVAT